MTLSRSAAQRDVVQAAPEVDVLIVGGGAVGLSCSIMLSDLGVEHLLIERRACASSLPKAHLLNQRTMEIYRQHHLADSVTEIAAAMRDIGRVRYMTSLAGDQAQDAHQIYQMDAFGGGATHARYVIDSPVLNYNLPQCRLEPILRSHAEQRSPGRIRFSHELDSLVEQGDRVVATVRALDNNDAHTVRAKYVVAADGGRTVGPLLGVQPVGATGLIDILSIHFDADLSRWWPDDTLMTWFVDPGRGDAYSNGCLVAVGPTWGRHSEQWNLHVAVSKAAVPDLVPGQVAGRVRDLLQIPELAVTVRGVNRWSIDSVVADQYRIGRILLAGDAAHRHSPATGLGLNTGIQDVHNLAWKLRAVLTGVADDALLDTYDQERRAVGNRNVQWATFAATNHDVLSAALGLTATASPGARATAVPQYFEDTPMGATRRARAAEILATQRITYQAHDLELGFAYSTGAMHPDGTDAPAVDPMGSVYRPTTRPGHRLPHAWLLRNGQRVSTHDLVDTGDRLVLLAGPDGEDWCRAAEQVAPGFGTTVEIVRTGDGEWTDPDQTWLELSQVGRTGAVLIRPDNHVAWRSGATGHTTVDTFGEMRTALQSVLCRPPA